MPLGIDDLKKAGMKPGEAERLLSPTLPELQEELIESKDSSDLRAIIERIMSCKGKPFDKHRKISDHVIRLFEEEGGEFLQSENGGLFYFSKRTHTLENLEGGTFRRKLASKTGLRTIETVFEFVLDSLKTEASEQTPVKVHTCGYLDKASGRLNVSFGGARVYSRDPGGNWIAGWNGENGLMFHTCDGAEDADPDFTSTGALDWLRDQTLIDGSGLMTREDQWSLAVIWLASRFIPSLTHTILLALGEQGSGKTSFIRMLGRVVVGPNFEVSSIGKDHEDGLLTELSNSLIVAIDNADSRIDYLEDFLATFATGIKVPRRKLYTTNERVAIELRAALAISSRDPHFKREDVAERVLPIRFVAPTLRISEDELLDGLMKRRAGILGELLILLGKIADSMATKTAPRSKLRMADFARLGWHYFDAISPEQENQMPKLIEKIEFAQAAFAGEGDSTITVLGLLLREEAALCLPIRGEAIGTIRDVTPWLKRLGTVGPVLTGELYKVYSEICDEQKLPKLKSPASFGKKLSAMRQIIERQLNASITFEPAHAGGTRVTIVAKPE